MGIFFIKDKQFNDAPLNSFAGQPLFLLKAAAVLAVFLFLSSGCAHFKGSESSPKPSEPVQVSNSTSKTITQGENGAVPDGSVTSSGTAASAISQPAPAALPASSVSAPSGSAASNSASAVSPGTGSASGSSSSSSSDSVLKNPNDPNAEGITPTSFTDKEIPNGYNHMSSKEDSSFFQNAGLNQSENPIGNSAGGGASSQEIPAGQNHQQSSNGVQPQNRVTFRTICE